MTQLPIEGTRIANSPRFPLGLCRAHEKMQYKFGVEMVMWRIDDSCGWNRLLSIFWGK